MNNKKLKKKDLLKIIENLEKEVNNLKIKKKFEEKSIQTIFRTEEIEFLEKQIKSSIYPYMKEAYKKRLDKIYEKY